MRTFRQLLRQPLRTLAGVLLTAIAVAVLGVSASQNLAALDTTRKLKETYITVGLPGKEEPTVVLDGQLLEGTLPEENANALWLDTVAEKYPDIIEKDVRHGLATAWIPELAPCVNSPSCDDAMLEITLTQIGYVGKPTQQVWVQASDEMWQEQGISYYQEMQEVEGHGIYAELIGTLDRVLMLQECHGNPEGFRVKLKLWLPDMAAFEALKLEPGQRYLVCGSGFTDLDKQLRMQLAGIMTWRREEELPQWDLSTLEEYEDPNARAQEFYDAMAEGREPDYSNLPTVIKCKIGDLYHGLTAAEKAMFRTITLTLEDRSILPGYEADARYCVPTITPLTDTAEAFLSGSTGTLWQKTLEEFRVNTRTFAVMGVENLQYVGEFAAGRADIAQGRSFTPGEIKAGERVCVISQYLAEENGLQVGDTIDLRYFHYDFENPYQSFIRDGGSTVNPMPYRWFSDTMTMTEGENYTIVGLYRLQSPWNTTSEDQYKFTPNTIFVPQTSVTGSMDYSDRGQFRTFVVESDRLGDLINRMIDAGVGEALVFFDNGYNDIAHTLVDFEAAARQILPIGIAVYAVVMLLFLFLFPAREGKSLARMDSLGAEHGKRVSFLVHSTLGILIPGSLLGTLIALQLWQIVARALSEYMQTDIAVELNVLWLWLVMAVQLAAVTGAAGLLGSYMSRNINPMHKR